MRKSTHTENQHEKISLEYCEKITRRLLETVKNMVFIRSMLESANNDKDLINCFNNTPEAFGLGLVRFSLVETLLMQTVRCWDKSGSDRASFPRLVQILEQEPISNELIERAAAWTPQINWADRNREIVRKKIIDFRQRNDEQNSGQNKETLDRLVFYRNNFISHNLLKISGKNPLYGDLFSVVENTIPMAEISILILAGEDIDFSDWNDIGLKQAKKFWSSVRNGQILNRNKRQLRHRRFGDDPPV